MNRLVRVPYKLKPYLDNFSDLFAKPGFNSFCHLTAAIAVCNKSKTVSNLHETMANDNKEKKGRSSYNWFIYVLEGLNLPVPDEGGLPYRLKAIGIKVGT